MGTGLKQSFIEAVKAGILSGKMKPGDKLPSERELAESFGLSRSSVNQGILDLERMGFLRIVSRKGTFVADYVHNATPDMLSAIMSFDTDLIDRGLFADLMEMRILIEIECVRLACKRVNSDSIRRLNNCSAKIYSADSDELPEALYGFHKTIVELSGNSAYLLVFQSFDKLLHKLIEAHYSEPGELKFCLPLYDELAVSIKLSDVERSEKAMSEILSRASKYLNSHLKDMKR